LNKQNIIFIVNPISGIGKQKGIDKTITEIASKHQANVEIEFTKHTGHAYQIALNAVQNRIHTVVIVGGDGSVNEVGKALMNTDTKLGIIPIGSGNGLARHLKIPLEPKKAIELVFKGKTTIMDVGKIEEHIFLSTAGFGFDAHVAHIFAQQSKRGFRTYIKTVRKELFKFKAFEFNLINEKITNKAFMLSIANIPQFGNNFTINPNASEKDGLLNCTLIKPFPKYKIPLITSRFFAKSIHNSRYFHEWIAPEFEFEIPHLIGHVDGEPIVLKNMRNKCTIEKSCLNVII
jgi:diacylglycerol kinase (ATP)